MIETKYGLKTLNSRPKYCMHILIIGSFLVKLYLVPCVALTFVLLEYSLLFIQHVLLNLSLLYCLTIVLLTTSWIILFGVLLYYYLI